MGDALGKLITESSLARLAGGKSFARGMSYFQTGAVVDLVTTGDAIKAKVIGGDEYRVVPRPRAGELEWSCTCPMGEEGDFCKHAVAAGLAWLARDEPETDELADVRKLLERESKEALVAIVLDQAAADIELRARLQSAALRKSPSGDVRALKHTVRRAFASTGFVDYHQMPGLIARAETVTSLLGGLLADRRAADAVALADYAMRLGISVCEDCDDSNGGFGDALREIAALHLQACKGCKPAPEGLGRSLFELQMLDSWGFFPIESYVGVLGKRGFDEYRALAERAWKELAQLEPGSTREFGEPHFRVTGVMERIARLGGDVDAMVAVNSRDLSRSYRFVEIARIPRRGGPA